MTQELELGPSDCAGLNWFCLLVTLKEDVHWDRVWDWTPWDSELW